MGAVDAERIFMKYIINNGADDWESAAPGEDLHLEALPNGNVAVRVRSVPDMYETSNLYGKAANDMVWTDKGTLASKEGNRFNRIAVFGKMGPGSIITGRDAVYPGYRLRAARAGIPLIDEGHTAYEAGHITMLRELLKKPVIANLVKGLDPKMGTPRTKAARIIQEVLRGHKSRYGEDIHKDHNTAFDTWPKLMTFLESVDVALDKAVEDGNLKENPLNDSLDQVFTIFSGTPFSKVSDWSDKDYNNVALARLPGESDADFYNRHLAEVNEHNRSIRPPDRYKNVEMTLDQYYNWIIDNMVNNLYVVSKALAGRDKELQEVINKKLQVLKTEARDKAKADEDEWWQMTKNDIHALHGFMSREKYLEQSKKDVEEAIARIKGNASKKSLSDRKALAELRLAAANKMLKQTMDNASSQKNKNEGERRVGEARAVRDAFAEIIPMLDSVPEAAVPEAAVPEAVQSSGEMDRLMYEEKELKRQLEDAIRDVAVQYKARLEEKGLSEHEVRYRVQQFLEEETYKEKSKKCRELVSRVSAIEEQIASLGNSGRQAARGSSTNGSEAVGKTAGTAGGSDAVTMQLLNWMERYKEKQDRKLRQVQEQISKLEQVKAKYDNAKASRASRIGQLDNLKSSAGVWLFQMGAKESDMATLDDLLGENSNTSAVPITSSNVRLVSTGILLGKTGMRLEQVRKACKRYYAKRARGAEGADAFYEEFNADPFNTPSDERIKDFHGSWRKARDNEDCQARIVEAVNRRFF